MLFARTPTHNVRMGEGCEHVGLCFITRPGFLPQTNQLSRPACRGNEVSVKADKIVSIHQGRQCRVTGHRNRLSEHRAGRGPQGEGEQQTDLVIMPSL